MVTATATASPSAPVSGLFLTQAELQVRWKRSAMFLWRLRNKGKIPVHNIGARGIRFSLEDVLEYERAAKVDKTPEAAPATEAATV